MALKINDMSQEKFIREGFEACKQALLYVGIFSFFANVLMLTVPLYMMQLYDRVLSSHSFETLVFLTLIAGIALATYALLEVARSHILIKVSRWLDNYLSPAALSRSADEILQGRTYGSQALRDITSLRQFAGSPGVFALFDVPWVPIYLFVIYILHPVLGIIATLGAIVLFGLAVMNERVTGPALKKANNVSLSTQQYTDAAMRNAEVIQAMGMMPNIVKKWFHKNEEVLELQSEASYQSGIILSISKFCRLMLQLLMLGIGAWLVLQNQLTAGSMIAGSILLGRALAPVEQIIGVWKQLMSAQQSLERLRKHFLIDTNRSAGIALPKPHGHVELKNVYYAPVAGQKPIINNISLEIAAGEMVAIVGPSAAGKSTLARLIVGAWPATSGSVRLDGANVFTWDRPDFGRHVGYLPQDVELFSGSVKENIARLGEIEDEEVIAAAQLAGVHDLILKLPDGYNTEIGASGLNLSGGQRQRIALARALYKKPTLLVLDEPNSNLDNDGELALVQALTHMHEQGSTIILVAHRPSIVRGVDRMVVLNQGQVQFTGPRDQILEKISLLNTPARISDPDNTGSAQRHGE